MADPAIRFTYWSDPLCIWAFVAQARLDALLARYPDALDVEYRVVPVFGSVAQRFRDGVWAKAGVEGRVEATRSVAARFGIEGVSGEVWRTDPPSSSWAAGAVIKAGFALESAGQIPAGTGARLQLALRQAFFQNNQNVTRRSVQLEVCEAEGVPTGEVEAMLDDGRALALLWEDHEERQAQLIQGSPSYVFDGGRAKLYGNVNERVLRATVDELVSGREIGCSDC